jgi:hypothetical protein
MNKSHRFYIKKDMNLTFIIKKIRVFLISFIALLIAMLLMKSLMIFKLSLALFSIICVFCIFDILLNIKRINRVKWIQFNGEAWIVSYRDGVEITISPKSFIYNLDLSSENAFDLTVFIENKKVYVHPSLIENSSEFMSYVKTWILENRTFAQPN